MTDSTSTLPPMRLGEIVLATGRYEILKEWYRQMLDIDPSLEHVTDNTGTNADPTKPTRRCFFRMHLEHPYQDVVAIFEVPNSPDTASGNSRLHHMQLRNASIAVLRDRYRRLRAAGVVPHLAMDHGSSTSLYYHDPDQNVVEIAASNFATQEETLACLASEAYRRNPSGNIIDPESWV